jgi:hypothetical protein
MNPGKEKNKAKEGVEVDNARKVFIIEKWMQ